jgi:YVTN family beta-propeller protein
MHQYREQSRTVLPLPFREGGRGVRSVVLRVSCVFAVVAVPLLLVAVIAGRRGAPPEHGLLYVANLRSSDISVIDLATGRETARIPVADNPHELIAAEDAVWVSNYRSAAVTLLSARDRPDSPFPLGKGVGGLGLFPVSGEPHGLAVVGERVAVTQGRDGRVALIDAITGGLTAEIVVGGEPHMAAAAGGRLYVVDAAGDALVEIDPDAGAVTRRLVVGRTPESLALSPDGRTAAVANARSADLSLVDLASFTERARVPLPGAPVRVLYSPDGRTLAVSLNDTGRVLLLDPASAGVRASIPAGERPDGLAFSPSGRLLYVALTGDHRVAVLRVKDHRLLGTLYSGDGPSGLLVTR